MKKWSAQLQTSRLLLVVVGSVALAACSSSGGKCSPGGCVTGSAGGGGGLSGSGGGDAAAGASGDAASGDAAVAGRSGGGGSGGGAGAPPDGGSADVSTCSFPASLGAATVVMTSDIPTGAVEGGDRSTITPHDSVTWLGQINTASRPDVLDIQLYKNAAPFGAMLSSMSISLVGQSNFATCGACVLFHPLYNDGAPLHAQTNYIATAGTLNLTAVPSGAAMKLTATLSNVTFEHVMIDSSFATTKTDGCTITLTSASIDAPFTPTTP